MPRPAGRFSSIRSFRRGLGTITHLGTSAGSNTSNESPSVSPAAGGMLIAVVVHSVNSELTSMNTGTLTGTWVQHGSRFDGGSSGLIFSIYTCKDYGASGTVKGVKASGSLRVHVLHMSVRPAGTFSQSKNSTGPGFSTTSDSATLDVAPTWETLGVAIGGSAQVTPGGLDLVVNTTNTSTGCAIGAKSTGSRSTMSSSWTGNQFAHTLILELAA